MKQVYASQQTDNKAKTHMIDIIHELVNRLNNKQIVRANVISDRLAIGLHGLDVRLSLKVAVHE